MRLKNLILSDIRFQIKHGFYFLYIVITLLYITILSLVPELYKSKVTSLIIFSDPATLGLFFMGAIILLEKSQRVLSSIAVSPVKIWEYIFSKVMSLSFIGTLVAVLIGVSSGSDNLFWGLVGTFLGSVLFSFVGIIVGANISSINGFIVATIPAMLVLMSPAIAELFGYSDTIFLFNPGNTVLRLISGNTENILIGFAILIIWLIFFYKIAKKSVEKMMTTLGGIQL